MARLKRRKAIAGGLIVAGVVIVAGLVSLVASSQGTQDLTDVKVVVDKVGEHYMLPDNETPALATVEDKTKLTSEFLRAAEDGDKLLVYKDAKKVLLYRPSIDKIVEVGPVSIAPTGMSGN